MINFTSYEKQLEKILKNIISSSILHQKWLNTLSYLENCGAKQIAACQHPTFVKEDILQHAAEEFRHAYYLKKQIKKISCHFLENYQKDNILGGVSTWHYLKALNVKTSRYLKEEIFLPLAKVKELAYLFVTYAIELRAKELYSLYDQLLCYTHSKIHVKSILIEENNHLAEMESKIKQIEHGFLHAEKICGVEDKLCQKWLFAIEQNIEQINLV